MRTTFPVVQIPMERVWRVRCVTLIPSPVPRYCFAPASLMFFLRLLPASAFERNQQ